MALVILDKFLPCEISDMIYKKCFSEMLKTLHEHHLAGNNKWNNPSYKLILSSAECSFYNYFQESQDPTYNVFAVIE